jgi:hypothetical protein
MVEQISNVEPARTESRQIPNHIISTLMRRVPRMFGNFMITNGKKILTTIDSHFRTVDA